MQTRTHTCAHVNTFHRKISWEPKVRSEDVVVVNIARCFRGTAPEKNSQRLWVLLPLVPAANHQNITHTHTYTHRWETYQFPLSRLPTALLQPIIIDDLFNPEEGDGSEGLCPLISSLWTSSGCGCYCLPLCALKLAPTHTHTHTHTHAHANPCNPSHTHFTTASDRRVGLDISSFGSV